MSRVCKQSAFSKKIWRFINNKKLKSDSAILRQYYVMDMVLSWIYWQNFFLSFFSKICIFQRSLDRLISLSLNLGHITAALSLIRSGSFKKVEFVEKIVKLSKVSSGILVLPTLDARLSKKLHTCNHWFKLVEIDSTYVTATYFESTRSQLICQSWVIFNW